MKQYRDELDALRFTTVQKQEIVNWMLSAGTAKPRAAQRRFKRNLVVGIAAALCLTTTALALPGSPVRKLVSEMFAGIFGGEIALADEIGAPVAKSATSNGITVTADAILGDESSLCIVFSISREDGQPFSANGISFGPDSLDLLSNSPTGGHGYSYFISGEPGSNAVRYVECITIDEGVSNLRSQNAALHFKDLQVANEAGITESVEGEWDLNIPLAYTDATRHFSSDQFFSLTGKTFRIRDAALSPIGFHLSVVSEEAIPFEPSLNAPAPADQTDGASGGVAIADDGSETVINGDSDSRDVYWNSLTARLILTDGTVIDLTTDGRATENLDDDRLLLQCSGVFQNLIADEDMAALEIGGVRIPLS